MKSSKQSIAAVFDVDGTLVAGASLEARFIKFLWRYGELSAKDLARLGAGAWQALAAGRSPVRANKAYLRDKDAARMRMIARDCFEQEIKRRLLPSALFRLRWHQEAGHAVVLLSGALDLLLEPLAAFLDVTAQVGTATETDGGRLTGRIAGEHPYNRAKVACLMSLTEARPFDLARSFAYANHYTDRHLLAAVGNPVAANPDRRLRGLALKRGWLIEDFCARGAR
jgi:HAD superfamily hydrolase (TIGR01490 family)